MEQDSGKGQASSRESSPSQEPQEHLIFFTVTQPQALSSVLDGHDVTLFPTVTLYSSQKRKLRHRELECLL